MAAIFEEFVQNIQSSAYHPKWVKANPAEAGKWATFRDAVLAYKSGDSVAAPSMATKYGRALVAAGKLHMSVTDIGADYGSPPSPPPPPPPTPVTWESPITISSGQTITGRAFESTSGPAISITTAQPVVIENCQIRQLAVGSGYIIDAYNGTPAAADITIRNCIITGLDDWDSPRWFVCQNWKNLRIESCTILNTRGIELWPNHQPNPTTVITKNRHTNIKGTTDGGNLNLVGNFVQFRVIWGGPQDGGLNTSPGTIEVSWNEIYNEPNEVNAEDLISVYKSGHLRIRDNMFWHHSKPSGFTGSSQNGITIDPSGEPNLCADNIVERCQVVQGHGIGHFGGNNNLFLNNRVIAANSQGTRGMKLQPGFTGCHAHGNLLGFDGFYGRIDGDLSGAVEGEGNGVNTGEWANNTHYQPYPGDVPASAETAEWTFWLNKKAANGITVGSTLTTGWQDDFETINPGTWQKKWWFNADDYDHDQTVEIQAWRDANAFTSGGILNLVAKRETVTDHLGRTRNFTSGIVQTNGVQGVTSTPGPSFTYGLFEARMKSAPGVGMWSTFWLCDAGWPSYCPNEIDIVEIVGSNPAVANYNVHLSGVNQGSAYTHSENLDLNYHIYGLEWRSSYIAWFFDGVEKFRYTGANIPSNAHYIILGLQVGGSGSWAGTPAASFTQATQFVDWVRVSS